MHSKKTEGLNRRSFLKILGAGAALTAVGNPGCDPNKDYKNSKIYTETHKVKPLTQEIVRYTQSDREAVLALLQYCEKNFFHYYREGENENYPSYLYGPDNYFDTIEDISIEDVFRERAVGCHLMSWVMATMLRSVNIPAQYTKERNGKIGSYSGHGVLEVPNVGYVHGDHVANLVATPADMLLMKKNEMEDLSSNKRGDLQLLDELIDSYWLKLRRRVDNSRKIDELFITGQITGASQPEVEDVLNNVSEYGVFVLEDNSLWTSQPQQIKELEW